MRPAVLSLVLALIAAPAGAADAVTVARAALAELEAAGRALAEAEGAQDRVAALTAVIHAYETGLGALREGLRQAAIQEAALIRGLDAESSRVAGLLGALETLETRGQSRGDRGCTTSVVRSIANSLLKSSRSVTAGPRTTSACCAPARSA
jgi:hypothetical protein